MTEKEKMISGLFYTVDNEISTDHKRAKRLCYEFNHHDPDDEKGAFEIIRKLINIGENFNIKPMFNCKYGYNITIGRNFYANMNCTMLDANKITIGNNVIFAPSVSLFTSTHPVDAKTRNSGREMAYPIKIGNNVWISGNVTVLPGVTIGDNAVIGGGAVVVKDIPPFAVAVGNPAKVVKILDKNTDDDGVVVPSILW